jgi:hypothetical protein
VSFDDAVQAFFSAGIYDNDEMVVMSVWGDESDPGTEPYGGREALLEAFLSTMLVWPQSYPVEERDVRDVPGTGGLAAPQAAPLTAPELFGWPGIRPGPAGLYSWFVGDDERWMHNRGGVSITIQALDADEAYTAELGPADSDGLPAYRERPVKVAERQIQTWFLDVGDTHIIVRVDWDPNDTDPAAVAEAVAVVESIRVRPTEDGDDQRLVFRLGEGWDSG